MSSSENRPGGTEFEPQPGVRGWWVVHKETFVFFPPSENLLMTIRLPSGETCFGFDVVSLAGRFGMDAGTLITNVQIGGLTISKRLLPPIGTKSRVEYMFEIPMHDPVTTIVNTMPIGGTA